MNIYVGNLAYSVDEGELQALFANYGTVASASIITDRETGQSKGFGFVEMPVQEEAEAAIAGLNGVEHRGRQLTVNEARPRGESGGRDRGFGGGRGGGRRQDNRGGGGYDRGRSSGGRRDW